MATTGTKSRSLLAPLIGGVVLIVLLVGIIAFRNQLGDLITDVSREGGGTVLRWIPDHLGATLAIAVAFIVALGINWIAHVSGRLRAWIFVLVIEIGLWFLFWNSVGIPSLKDLFGLESLERIAINEQIVILLGILILSGVVFWFLEVKEAWSARRHRTGGGD